jgi:hypothetical protein
MPSIPQDYGRMGHFHDTYAGDERLAPLVREMGWTHNLRVHQAHRGRLYAPEELRGQLLAPDQVSKLLEDL